MILPACSHRGSSDGENVECGSNRWLHQGTVPLSLCEDCRYADMVNLDLAALRVEQSAECIHRGDVIRVQCCDLCGPDKGTDFQVLACYIHGECSLRKLHSRVRGCAGCEDRAEG